MSRIYYKIDTDGDSLYYSTGIDASSPVLTHGIDGLDTDGQITPWQTANHEYGDDFARELYQFVFPGSFWATADEDEDEEDEEDGEYIDVIKIDRLPWQCFRCSKTQDHDTAPNVARESDGEVHVCDTCLDREYSECDDCGEMCRDLTEVGDNKYCARCLDEHETDEDNGDD